MCFRILFLLVMGLSVVRGFGQDVDWKRNVLLYGTVCNSITRETIKNARVVLVNSAKVQRDTFLITEADKNQVGDKEYAWIFLVPRERAEVSLLVSAEGYEPRTIQAAVSPKGSKKAFFIGDIRLKRQRKDIELGTATVKATQVKFYTRKDTMVFNASAFQLAEGSMLDALIRQLPGVELKDDGRIFVNGRYVESLLLNGEEFFNNKREIMLDNLPSYMVNNVQVYEKSSKLSEAVGHDVEKKQFVMDVKLKRQYSIGWLANAEGGMGTEDRYMGRFFGLRFTPQSRVSVFGNLNNINEKRKPGQNGDWSPDNLSGGLDATKMFGIDYQVRDIDNRFEVSGSAQIEHLDRDNRFRVSGERFLPDGNTFSRQVNQLYSCNTLFSTSHSLELKWKYLNLQLRPRLAYQHWDNRGRMGEATFAEDPESFWEKAWEDSLMKPTFGNVFRQTALNKILSESKVSGHELSTGLDWEALVSFNTTENKLNLSGNVNYADRKEDRFNQYRLDFPKEGAAATDFRNQWYKDRPNRNYGYNGKAEYIFLLGKDLNSSIRPFYEFTQHFTERDYALYRLDRLEGWGEDTDNPLGALPSETEHLLDALDNQNSFRNRYTETGHRTGVNFYWFLQRKNGNQLQITGEVPVRFARQKLDYMQADVDTVFSKNRVFFEPSVEAKYSWNDQKKNTYFRYEASSASPDPVNLLNIENNADPLDISLGNPDLETMHRHHLLMGYESRNASKQRFLGVNIHYQITQNAIAWGYTYDKQTGVRTSRPENVNGNYSFWGGVNYSMPLDKARRLTFSTNSSASFTNSVDLVRLEHEAVSSRSTVQSLLVGENLKLDYRIGKLKLGIKGGGTWTRAAGRRDDFRTINAGDFNYGVTMQAELPWDLQFYTDLTQYSRRGYEDGGMNTDDLVWNARLAKRCMKGRLTLLLDGFDILHNLSNVTRSLNAQGRVETYRNVIPRYVMLHAVYRFNIQPKKRPGEA